MLTSALPRESFLASPSGFPRERNVDSILGANGGDTLLFQGLPGPWFSVRLSSLLPFLLLGAVRSGLAGSQRVRNFLTLPTTSASGRVIRRDEGLLVPRLPQKE